MKHLLRTACLALFATGVLGATLGTMGCNSTGSSSTSSGATYKCAMASCTKTKPATADGAAPS